MASSVNALLRGTDASRRQRRALKSALGRRPAGGGWAKCLVLCLLIAGRVISAGVPEERAHVIVVNGKPSVSDDGKHALIDRGFSVGMRGIRKYRIIRIAGLSASRATYVHVTHLYANETAVELDSPFPEDQITPSDVFEAVAEELNQPVNILETGHGIDVPYITFGAADNLLYSAKQKSVKVWDITSGRIVADWATSEAVDGITYLRQANSILVADDGFIDRLDAQSGRLQETFVNSDGAGGRTSVKEIVPIADGAAFVTRDHENTKIWKDGQEIVSIRDDSYYSESSNDSHMSHNFEMAATPDGRFIAVVVCVQQPNGYQDQLRIFDGAGKPLRTLNLSDHHELWGGLAFSYDGTYLATAGEVTNIWRTKDWAKVAESEELRLQICFSHSSSRFVTVESSGSVVISDAAVPGWRLPLALPPQEYDFVFTAPSVAYSFDDLRLAAGESDGSILVWDLQKPTLAPSVLKGSEWPSLATSSISSEYIAFSSSRKVEVWSLKNGWGHTVAEDREYSSVPGFMSDSKTLVYKSRQHGVSQLTAVNLQTGRCRDLGSLPTETPTKAYEVDGLATGGGRTAILYSQVPEGEAQVALFGPGESDLETFHLRNFEPKVVALPEDGRLLVVGGGHHDEPSWLKVLNPKHARLIDGYSDLDPTSRYMALPNSHLMTRSEDGKYIALSAGNSLMIFDASSGVRVGAVNTPFEPDGIAISSAQRHVAAALGEFGVVWDFTGQLKAMLQNPEPVHSVEFVGTTDIIACCSLEGPPRLWQANSGRLLGTAVTFETTDREQGRTDDLWVFESTDGRFDTGNLDEIKGLHWIFPDVPLLPFGPEMFMRDYYEPRLLPRLLSGDEMPKVRPLGDLNRVQPGVKIVSVEQGTQPDLAEVAVEVSPAKGQFQRSGKAVEMTTEVYDLRLFRGGQLVGQEPELSAEAEANLKNGVVLSTEELNEWKAARQVKPVAKRVSLDPATGKLQRTFTVRLPHAQAGKEIEFTAYAFNEDRVKSATDPARYKLPLDLGPVKRRAYVVTMGVNAYENPGWDLRFAASDAKRMQDALSSRLEKQQYEVVPVTLISDYRIIGGVRQVMEDHATREGLHSVLELLAGHTLSEELKKNLPPGAEKIDKAEPDDLVMLTVSSHGYTSKEGLFYIVPSNSGETTGRGLTAELRRKWISSDELSAWLRDVDAGDLVMIVDTCHSAATVNEPGFKPGPMGSRGLGQLAYDKGMRILAASQADDVALESEKLKQGLLTYALVHDGLEAKQAVKTGTNEITLESWLQYGSQRVPLLYQEVLKGNVQTFAEGSKDVQIDAELSGESSSLKKPTAFQQPSLFNFQKNKQDVQLQ